MSIIKSFAKFSFSPVKQGFLLLELMLLMTLCSVCMAIMCSYYGLLKNTERVGRAYLQAGNELCQKSVHAHLTQKKLLDMPIVDAPDHDFTFSFAREYCVGEIEVKISEGEHKKYVVIEHETQQGIYAD